MGDRYGSAALSLDWGAGPSRAWWAARSPKVADGRSLWHSRSALDERDGHVGKGGRKRAFKPRTRRFSIALESLSIGPG